jgi:hypothetical protein
VKFKPREVIREMRGSAADSVTWTDAGDKRWSIGKTKRKESAYSIYLGQEIPPFPHENDTLEKWSPQLAVRYGEEVGAQFLAQRTPLIVHNRLWRAVVTHTIADATDAEPTGKRTRNSHDWSRPTYWEREEARESLLYSEPPPSDCYLCEGTKTVRKNGALYWCGRCRKTGITPAGLETLSECAELNCLRDVAWELAANHWELPPAAKVILTRGSRKPLIVL